MMFLIHKLLKLGAVYEVVYYIFGLLFSDVTLEPSDTKQSIWLVLYLI